MSLLSLRRRAMAHAPIIPPINYPAKYMTPRRRLFLPKVVFFLTICARVTQGLK